MRRREQLDKIVVLGTGTAIVSKYFNTCFALCHDDTIMLVDGGGGHGILQQMDRAGLSWDNVHDIFVSHEHTDHLFGIFIVIRYIGYLMELGKFEGDLRFYCCQQVYDKIMAISCMIIRPGERSEFGKRMQFIIIKDRETRNAIGYDATFFDIQSKKAPQFGFKMKMQDKTLTFLGDEPCSESCIELVKNSDWLLAEAFCLYADREIHKPYLYHHTTVRDASELAEKCNVRNLVIWHTEDATWPNRKELYTKEAKQYYKGNVYVPEDLEVLDI
jgi:ribonuclease Z